jgi:type II secretory pathway pseudopilin PulG/predicted NAD-dependent protein-ADP-ribosyltransferase YbiA (DUF1768 family)
MMKRRQRSLGRKQQGFVLIALVAFLVVGGLYFFISNLSPEAIEARRQEKTEAALVQAREALIGYALQYREVQAAKDANDTGDDDQAMYGYLPLPDLGTGRNNNTGCTEEGCDANTFTGIAYDANGIVPTVVGRFPWRTLGTEALRDGHGECLWLIVSSLHGRIQRTVPPPILPTMNWDTLGQLDIVTANGTNALTSALAIHDRPVAIIFAPGPPLPGQNRSKSTTDDVTQCGGNYDAANYLDPAADTALGGIINYLAGTNKASALTGDSDTSNDPDDVLKKSMLPHGKIFKSGANYLPAGCTGANCELVVNDIGLPISSESLFGAIRKNTYFRTDINNMLERMAGCLRDQFAAGGSLTLDANSANLQGIAGDKTAGRIPANDPCYGDGLAPKGYYSHYKELVFVAKPNSGAFTVNGQSCAGTVLFANQRGAGQNRVTAGTGSKDKNTVSNFLEDENLISFTNSSIPTCPVAGSDCLTFSGAEQFDRVSSTQPAARDIVRCIPSGASLATTPSPDLAAAGLSQIASYAPGTRTLTLGQEVATSLPAGSASDLFGCAWIPETHAMNGGLRSYFQFRIIDAGFSSAPLDGFTFAIVDGDNNGTNACGAARQHLGYSGNNLDTPFIVPPKIALEIDLRLQGTFNPALSNTLSNGRNDPSYSGGHVAIDYWGGETPILATGTGPGTFPPCTAPRYAVGSDCYLPQEEDDNVHGRAPNARSGFPPPPANPSAPATAPAVPPDTPGGVYKLDPNLSSIPINQDIHVRVETTRTAATYNLPKVRVATTTNLNLASPGTSVDGVVLATGDRVLVKDQATPAENGIYTWKGAIIPMTRTADADATTELAGAIVEVEQGGQNARSIWRQSSTNPVLGTDPLRWANVRIKFAPQSNIDLASPGATLDGIRMAAGDRVLVKAQTVPADNGIYLWNGASTAMTRASDADTAAKLTGIVVQVQQGSDATAWWRYDGASWSRLSVRVAAQSAVNLASPGASIDGIALVAGDRVLVKAQASSAENGIHVWNGPAIPMTRATDADTAAELAGALTQILAGTDTGRAFRQTTLAAGGTLGADTVSWTAIDPSPRFLIEIWILPDSVTDANKIAAMKNTTRPMSLLYSSFVPHLRDTPTLGYPFRNVRLGFTIGQRTTVTDQTFGISNFFTTWLD